jgi:hypothetical protein
VITRPAVRQAAGRTHREGPAMRTDVAQQFDTVAPGLVAKKHRRPLISSKRRALPCIVRHPDRLALLNLVTSIARDPELLTAGREYPTVEMKLREECNNPEHRCLCRIRSQA